MDYNRKGIPWYWLALFLIYIGVVVSLMFAIGNPYLYSTTILKMALSRAKNDIPLPTPSVDKQVPIDGNLGEEQATSRMDVRRNGVDSTGQTRDRKWVENWSRTIMEGAGDLKDAVWHMDESGVFLGTVDGKIWHADLEGKTTWRFELAWTEKQAFLKPVSDKQLVYFATSTGRMLAIRKATGRLQWDVRVGREILSPPLIRGDDLLIVLEPVAGLRSKMLAASGKGSSDKKAAKGQDLKRFVVARMHRKSGEFVSLSEPFETKSPSWLSYQPDPDLVVMTSSDRIMCLDGLTLSVKWNQILPEEIIPPALLTNDLAIVSTRSGKVSALSMSKKGGFLWEVDLESPAVGAPTLAPIYEQVAVQTKDTYLHMVDLKKGERKWRLALNNENPLKEGWTTRLNGRMIELTQMKWNYKGWTLWQPCGANKICIYNPEKGQLIERLLLSAQPISFPLYVDKSLYLLLKDKQGLKLSNAMEEDDWEKMKKAEKASQEEASKPGA